MMSKSLKIDKGKKNNIVIGGKDHSDADIKVEGFLGYISIYDNKIISLENTQVSINFEKSKEGVNLSYGDFIELTDSENNKIKLYYLKEYIEILEVECNNIHKELKKVISSSTLNVWTEAVNLPKDFPEYRRSPRQPQKFPNDKVELKPIPEKAKNKRSSLIKMIIPSLVMIVATVLMSIFMGRGIYMLVMVLTTFVTTIISITNYFEDKKDRAEEEKERIESYHEYLLNKRKELSKLRDEFINASCYHGLKIKEIENLIENYSNRIYEKSPTDNDFLTLSLGHTCKIPSYTINMPRDEIKRNKDLQYKEMEKVYENFSIICDIPYMIDLKKGHLGIVGNDKFTANLIKSILMQIAFYQSYHDVEIVLLTTENRGNKDFAWTRWLPHLKVKAINVSSLIFKENQRDQILATLTQVMKAREQKVFEERKETRFTPHYIFVIDSVELIENHSIMEHLNTKSTNLGFSLVYTARHTKDLPDNVITIVTEESNDKQEKNSLEYANILLNEGELINSKITLDDISNVNFELSARRLYPLIHKKTESAKIPKAISFLELYKVNSPDEINILDRWSSSRVDKSLRAPLGVKGKDDGDIIYLDIHEKYMGPHGLVAGTTGSGKSEILQSYILSMACNFSPQDIGFLLIDYKGGGMSNLFAKLPHLMGTITNLDGSGTARALASIKAELKRRQDILNKAGVNNINKYTAKYKDSISKDEEALEPLPHLIIISDEFAELKKERPEFMSELVSTARVGRSLGVHLILATQKPSGVVDDQIWSNSRFKLALKVADDGDSREIIGTTDAASIVDAGRAYLQVGNNEIYELFQSAYSGKIYQNKEEKEAVDERVYLINTLGQKRLFNGDDIELGEDINGVSELDIVIDEISDTYEKYLELSTNMGVSSKSLEIRKPWLEPLGEVIINEDLLQFAKSDWDTNIQDEKVNLNAKLGLVDIPSKQKQVEYCHNFSESGNIAIFGTRSTGKSTLLINISLELAIKNSSNLLNYYIVDFGNGALKPLENLPQTADYMSFDDLEKFNKFKSIIDEEIAKRKRLFRKTGATSINSHNDIVKNQNLKELELPHIIIYIDNYNVIKDMGYNEEEFFAKVTRDGVSVGIYTVVTLNSATSMKYNVLNNFTSRITNYLTEKSEYVTLIGRCNYEIGDIKGRGLVNTENEINIIQEYLPVSNTENSANLQELRDIIGKINEINKATKPKNIPMLPEKLYFDELIEKRVNKDDILLGLDRESVEPVQTEGNIIAIIGQNEGEKVNIFKIIYEQIKDKEIYIFDSRKKILSFTEENPNCKYLGDYSKKKDFCEKLAINIKQRIDEYKESSSKLSKKAFFKQKPPIYIFVSDLSYFADSFNESRQGICDIIENALSVGYIFVVSTLSGKLTATNEIIKNFVESKCIIGTGSPSDVRELKTGYGVVNDKEDIVHIRKDSSLLAVKVPIMEDDFYE